MTDFKRWSLFSTTPIVILILCGLAWAADQDNVSNATLRGLKGVYLRVVPMDPTLSKEVEVIRKIQKDTVEQVQRAGLEILDEAKFEKLRLSHAYPMARMDLKIQLIDIGDPDRMVLLTGLVISQKVLLPRNPVMRIWAPTWERRIIGVYRDKGTIYTMVKDIVSDFFGAYTSVN